MSDHVKIFDTTLRDGEQSPGISLDVGEKLEIADQLARLGVDVIEAGFPIASQGDFEAVEAIAKAVRGSTIAGLSRTAFKDVDRAWEAVRHAEQPRIHVFIATSPIHMKKKLRMTEDQVKAETAGAVARAKTYCDDVEFSPEDGSRSDVDFLVEVCQLAVEQRRDDAEHPRHRRLRRARGVRRADPSRHRERRRRLRGLDALPQRPGAGGGQLAGRCGRRRPPGGVRDQRPGRAGRQRRARRGRDGAAHAHPTTSGIAHHREDRGAGPYVATGRAPHRLPGAVQQGDHRPERVRARGRDPPARRARRPRDLRDHRRVDRRPGGRADRAGQALRTPRVRRLAGEDGAARAGRRAEPGVHAVQGAGRPQGRDHRGRPRGDRRRGARHRRRAPVHDREPRAARRHDRDAERAASCSPTATARSKATPRATA